MCTSFIRFWGQVAKEEKRVKKKKLVTALYHPPARLVEGSELFIVFHDVTCIKILSGYDAFQTGIEHAMKVLDMFYFEWVTGYSSRSLTCPVLPWPILKCLLDHLPVILSLSVLPYFPNPVCLLQMFPSFFISSSACRYHYVSLFLPLSTPTFSHTLSTSGISLGSNSDSLYYLTFSHSDVRSLSLSHGTFMQPHTSSPCLTQSLFSPYFFSPSPCQTIRIFYCLSLTPCHSVYHHPTSPCQIRPNFLRNSHRYLTKTKWSKSTIVDEP